MTAEDLLEVTRADRFWLSCYRRGDEAEKILQKGAVLADKPVLGDLEIFYIAPDHAFG